MLNAQRWVIVIAAIFMLTCVACGDGGSSGDAASGAPPLPRQGDPAFGTAGNVLIGERTDVDGIPDEVWIGFSRTQEWDDFLALNQRAPGERILPFIGGH